MAFLLSALSIDAYVLPGPATTTMRMRTIAPAMNEAAAKAAWFRKNELALSSTGGHLAAPPRAGATYSLAADTAASGGSVWGDMGAVVSGCQKLHGASGAIVSTNDILQKVRSKAEKAKKELNGPEVELCTDRKNSGWTTN